MSDTPKPRFDPDGLDAAIARGQADEFARFMTVEVARLKEEWIARVFMRVMPPKLFARSKFPNRRKNKRIIHRWMLANKVVLEDRPDYAEIRMDGEVIAMFRIAEKDGKFFAEEKIVPQKSSCQPPQQPV
jgi:hypothetical protein